jgi:hypothetical protein
MNFITAFQQGQKGRNKGLELGPGLEQISRAINGLQQKMIIGIGAAPKVGKSTFVDAGFVIGPILHAYENEIPLEYTYFSYEIDRISKEYDFAAYFFNYDHQINKVPLPEGVTFNGHSTIDISADFLLGKMQDDNNNTILVPPYIKDKLEQIYEQRIIPFFGQYDVENKRMSKGYINFIEEKDNPTGVRNFILDYARQRGKFVYEEFKGTDGKTGRRIVGYNPYNVDKYNIFVMDHLRKLKPERGYQTKQTVDKMVEYQVELRNWCGYSFIDIIHLNRSMSDEQRKRMMGDLLYPNSDDIKDTGNLAEEANHVFTMMNPNDDKYNLRKHFGATIKDTAGNYLYPKMRSIHLVESRHTFYPQHFRVNMHGNIKTFEKLEL